MKPPVDAPASRARRPATATAKRVRAASSFCPPRLTKGEGGPSRRGARPAATRRAGLSACAPATRTQPAAMAAWASCGCRPGRGARARCRAGGGPRCSAGGFLGRPCCPAGPCRLLGVGLARWPLAGWPSLVGLGARVGGTLGGLVAGPRRRLAGLRGARRLRSCRPGVAPLGDLARLVGRTLARLLGSLAWSPWRRACRPALVDVRRGRCGRPRPTS